jgi:hypothetical protein
MRKRQLWMFNAVLVLCVAGLAWRLHGEWQRGGERYARLAELSGERASVSAPPDPVRRSQRISANNVVAKNLFTPTRNNESEQEARPAGDTRLPIVFGTMKLGDAYEALMAEAGQAQNRRTRRVKAGEQVGAFTVVEIRDEAVVVERGGERATIDVYESANSVARSESRSAPVAASAPVVETAGASPGGAAAAPAATPQASSTTAPTLQTAPPGVDPWLKITVEGNRRRYERTTPFGPQVWYEEIQ